MNRARNIRNDQYRLSREALAQNFGILVDQEIACGVRIGGTSSGARERPDGGWSRYGKRLISMDQRDVVYRPDLAADCAARLYIVS